MDTASDLMSELFLLLEVLADSDVRELEVEENGDRIRIHRSLSVAATPVEIDTTGDDLEPAWEAPIHQIASPLVGTFYRASAPDMAPFVTEGSRIQVGTVVGIVEALQVLTEVVSEYSGVVTDAHLGDGQPVEYGRVLFEVRGD